MHIANRYLIPRQIKENGITAEQIDSALEPAGYLGVTDALITAALEAHETLKLQESQHG